MAQTRNWKTLRVSDHEEFRRQMWFEATLRGVKTLGYAPMSSDMAWLRSARESRAVNRIEPGPHVADKAGAPLFDFRDTVSEITCGYPGR